MKIKDVSKYLKKNIKNLLYLNGLDDWNIKFVISEEKAPDDTEVALTQACIASLLYEYKVATVIIYPASLHDEHELAQTVEHEIFHILLAPYDMYFNSLDESADTPLTNLEKSYQMKCHELAVGALEKREFRMRGGKPFTVKD